ncbi:uncharacterized protein LOC116205192 isoform X2 [Punica granatum]|uniref:Uncharacterized protein LOC116205192 isoform X2 n=1 Tax=Punica granatum TaxID=22663 RepID=A0A6P8DNW5_PUNGR|nr:uncharacterized protein LOC116205192 isoform X2 [Punica granatum]
MVNDNLWTDGLICAFELVRGRRKRSHTKGGTKVQIERQAARDVPKKQEPTDERSTVLSSLIDGSKINRFSPTRGNDPLERHDNHRDCTLGHLDEIQDFSRSYWVPIGWARISELVQTVQADAAWASQPINISEEEDNVTVADVATPYWERPVGPTWWCHVAADHPVINKWLSNAPWLHPAISVALRDETRLISERMKHLFYEVPVRVAGGLLFELLGQSAGDPYADEDDIPIVLRSWHAQNFLITSLHVKGSATNINVLGIAEVQEMLAAGGFNIPRSIHEVIARLACHLARWDDRRTQEDLHLFSIILNQEIRRLSTQVIRVKWSLHAREEIVFELLQHLKGSESRALLEGVRKSTREMIEEQEAVRGRLFTIQDVMQSTVRAWLQDKSLTVTHNLGVFGGCGLILSIITGLFGINVDGIPGAENSPSAFALFSLCLVLLGAVLIAIGLVYLGLKNPIVEEDMEVRKLELQELVRMFQQEAESHAQVRKTIGRNNIPPTSADVFLGNAGYVFIS